jgi:hypothetical protein
LLPVAVAQQKGAAEQEDFEKQQELLKHQGM